jgi:hypothetical protein
MPAAWTTPAQRDFLMSTRPRFLSHQEAHTLDEYWEFLYAQWDTLWPMRLVTAAEVQSALASTAPEPGMSESQWKASYVSPVLNVIGYVIHSLRQMQVAEEKKIRVTKTVGRSQ